MSQYEYARAPRRTHRDGLLVYYPKYMMIPKISDSVQALLMFPSIFRSLRTIHQSDPIDLVNVHWAYPDGVAAFRAARRLGIPCVITALGDDVNKMPSRLLIKRQLVRTMRDTEWITSVSKQIKANICHLTGRKEGVTVIPNGVNLAAFAPGDKGKHRDELGLPQRSGIILYIGRLSEEKGPQFLIQGMRRIESLKGRNPIELIVVGDGHLMPHLRQMAAEDGIEGRVRFVGEKDQTELPRWIAACDVLCLPSLQEGHPNVVMEALACGRPVVASNVGDLADFIAATNGIIFPAGDVEAMAHSLMDALGREWDPIGIRRTVENQSWEHCAALYHKVYKACLEL